MSSRSFFFVSSWFWVYKPVFGLFEAIYRFIKVYNIFYIFSQNKYGRMIGHPSRKKTSQVKKPSILGFLSQTHGPLFCALFCSFFHSNHFLHSASNYYFLPFFQHILMWYHLIFTWFTNKILHFFSWYQEIIYRAAPL